MSPDQERIARLRDEIERLQTMLEAHRALVSANPENEPKFREVNALLAAERQELQAELTRLLAPPE